MKQVIGIGDYLKVISFVFLLWISSIVSAQNISEYSLFASIDYSSSLVRLRVFPNGQIIDPHQQYGTLVNTSGLTYDTNRKYLYVSCQGYGSSTGGISSFTMQSDGTLIPLETTTAEQSRRTDITPNNQLLFPTLGTLSAISDSPIYSLSSTGKLIDTGNRYSRYGYPNIDPLGRIIISNITATVVISGNTTQTWVYHIHSINYLTKTVTLAQVVPDAGSNIIGIRFPKSGNMAIVYGIAVDTVEDVVSVLSIDSLGNVTTTNQNFSLSQIYNTVFDATLTPDDKYIFFCATTSIYVYSVNTTSRTITDTGYRSLPPNGKTALKFRLNDSGTFGVLLYEATDGISWLATAFVNPNNGHLTWTGYTFAIDSIYAGPGITTYDIQWVPVFTTSIPPELWREPPPETELHSSQNLFDNTDKSP